MERVDSLGHMLFNNATVCRETENKQCRIPAVNHAQTPEYELPLRRWLVPSSFAAIVYCGRGTRTSFSK